MIMVAARNVSMRGLDLADETGVTCPPVPAVAGRGDRANCDTTWPARRLTIEAIIDL